MARVKLKQVVDEIDCLSDDDTAYLNRETGELLTNMGDSYALTGVEPIDVEDPVWLALPDSLEIHEWEIMRDFAMSHEEPDPRDQLLQAIHGRGAFRVFKDTAARLGRLEAWFAYKQRAIAEVARTYLKAHDIEFEDDVD